MIEKKKIIRYQLLIFICFQFAFYIMHFANGVPIKKQVNSETTAKKRRIMHIYPLKSI